MPKRIQRKRAKGWKMPGNTVYVGRPGRWGNPFSQQTREENMALYRQWANGGSPSAVLLREAAARELRGKNLACWCPLDRPCHADVLLELANGGR